MKVAWKQPGGRTHQSLPKLVAVVANKRAECWVKAIKQRIRPMLGFQRFESAAVTIRGIELVQRIQKQQFKTGTLGGRSATMPELWDAVRAVRSEVLEIPGRIVHIQTLHQSTFVSLSRFASDLLLTFPEINRNFRTRLLEITRASNNTDCAARREFESSPLPPIFLQLSYRRSSDAESNS